MSWKYLRTKEFGNRDIDRIFRSEVIDRTGEVSHRNIDFTPLRVKRLLSIYRCVNVDNLIISMRIGFGK
jgi:hypothetical protein